MVNNITTGSSFETVFSAATQLSPSDQLRLIDALWDTLPDDAEIPLSEAWAREIERRVAELDQGKAQTVPWTEVREAALDRLRHGETR